MSKKCELIKDLLPLYADNVCTEESRKTVAEHLASCVRCRSELNKMQTEINITEKAEQDISIIKKIKRKILVERIIAATVTVLVLLFIALAAAMVSVNDLKAMNYEKNNLKANVYVEEDSEGKVWLVRKCEATDGIVDFGFRASGQKGKQTGMLVSENIKTDNPPVMNPLQKAEELDYIVTLGERKYENFMDNLCFPPFPDGLLFSRISVESQFLSERTLITDLNNPKSRITAAYYYDTNTDTEYLLWERS